MSFYKISENKIIPWTSVGIYDDKLLPRSGYCVEIEDIFMIISVDEKYHKLYNIAKNYIVHRENIMFDYCFVEI